MVEGRDDCVSFNVEGGMQGRIWIDAETHDVLRLDQRLSGLVEIPAAAEGAARASADELDDGAMGHVDSLQAGDVRQSGRNAGAAAIALRRSGHPRIAARRGCARRRPTRTTSAS